MQARYQLLTRSLPISGSTNVLEPATTITGMGSTPVPKFNIQDLPQEIRTNIFKYLTPTDRSIYLAHPPHNPEDIDDFNQGPQTPPGPTENFQRLRCKPLFGLNRQLLMLSKTFWQDAQELIYRTNTFVPPPSRAMGFSLRTMAPKLKQNIKKLSIMYKTSIWEDTTTFTNAFDLFQSLIVLQLTAVGKGVMIRKSYSTHFQRDPTIWIEPHFKVIKGIITANSQLKDGDVYSSTDVNNTVICRKNYPFKPSKTEVKTNLAQDEEQGEWRSVNDQDGYYTLTNILVLRPTEEDQH